ncbi:MAG: LysR substrate-binding domain-containing protein [Flavobacteriales bacterium]|nr:LysR substrate-binding domain-containing protein [Flavobacteriales bacterium]
MTLQQLQYVVALDNHRHFVQAAQSCSVAQPTLTLQVKKLEGQMNIQLFDRSKQPIKPTPMGKLFISKARHILREIDKLKELVNKERDRIDGEYSIGVIPTLSPYLLPLFIGDFVKSHPNTKLSVHELQSAEIIDRLQKGILDIGILATPLEEPNLREIPVFYEPFLLFANAEHSVLEHSGSISPEDLDENELWLLGQGHCFRNQTVNICQVNQNTDERNLMMEGGSIETLKKILQQVDGYTLIPQLSFNEQMDAPFVKRFKHPEPAREISIVVHRSFTREQLLTELRKSILANTPDNFEKNERFVTIRWR